MDHSRNFISTTSIITDTTPTTMPAVINNSTTSATITSTSTKKMTTSGIYPLDEAKLNSVSKMYVMNTLIPFIYRIRFCFI